MSRGEAMLVTLPTCGPVSGVPADGGRSDQRAQVCPLGPLQPLLHAVCQR